jgi:ATP-dependent Clp protease adaptor protein ClpS
MKSEDNKEYTPDLTDEATVVEPSLYQVCVHNDDYTPMEFVVCILEKFFYMSRLKATGAMMDAHVNGKSVCGVFSRDFAEAKVEQVVMYAREHEHPLICSIEGA